MRYKLLGIEEGSAICDFCHRKEITMLYRTLDNETGEIHSFGSSCILKALKISGEDFGRMKADKELKELKKPYEFNVFHIGNRTTANFMFNGVLYVRTYLRCSDKKVLTDSPFCFTDTKTHKYLALPLEIRKEFLAFFRKRAALEKILST